MYPWALQPIMTDAANPVLTVEKTVSIIEQLRDVERAGITELADELELGTTLVHNHLNTLREHGYVLKEGHEYRLSLRFLEVGGQLRHRYDIYQHGFEEIQSLASETGELANLVTHEEGLTVDLFRWRGEQAIGFDAPIGRRGRMHCTALGKAILSTFSDATVREIAERHGMPERTERTLTTPEALLTHLETVRDDGYAVDDEEKVPGQRCVAAPVNDDQGRAVGAVSVSGPTSRLHDDKLRNELSDQVRGTANVIELRIQHAGRPGSIGR